MGHPLGPAAQYKNELDQAETIELYPHEMNEVKILWADLQRKYGERPGTPQNMKALKDEAEDRFYGLGLRAAVDTANLTCDDDGNLIMQPVIQIVGRVEKHEFEFQRAMRETQLGFSDGKPGTITDDGRFVEPQKLL